MAMVLLWWWWWWKSSTRLGFGIGVALWRGGRVEWRRSFLLASPSYLAQTGKAPFPCALFLSVRLSFPNITSSSYSCSSSRHPLHRYEAPRSSQRLHIMQNMFMNHARWPESGLPGHYVQVSERPPHVSSRRHRVTGETLCLPTAWRISVSCPSMETQLSGYLVMKPASKLAWDTASYFLWRSNAKRGLWTTGRCSSEGKAASQCNPHVTRSRYYDDGPAGFSKTTRANSSPHRFPAALSAVHV